MTKPEVIRLMTELEQRHADRLERQRRRLLQELVTLRDLRLRIKGLMSVKYQMALVLSENRITRELNELNDKLREMRYEKVN